MKSMQSDTSQRALQEIYRRQVENARLESGEEWERRLDKSRNALRRDDCDAEAFIEAAYCQAKLSKHAEALSILEEGLSRCPASLRLHQMYISACEECNRTEEAIAAAQEAARRFPEDVWIKLKQALLLPVLYDSPAEVDRYRRRFAEGLGRVSGEISLDTPEAKQSALSAIGSHVNVRLGYQARNDRYLQSQYGELVHRIVASNFAEFVKPVQLPLDGPKGKLRVGYASARFRDLSATKCFLGWLIRHSQREFDIFSYHLGKKTDRMTEEVRRASGHFSHVPNGLEEAAKAIMADRLHILVFLDVGMGPRMMQVAALRLAPVQCMAWDQPITSGLPTLDYFISSALMEPENAKDHYSEELVRLPGLGVCFQNPVIPTPLLSGSRKEFKLREDAVVYLCCQAAYKYLPQYDSVFAEIAKQVPNAQFVFLLMNDLVAQDFEIRLDRAFRNAGLRASDHCVLLRQTDRFSYWNLNLASDVFLDTIGWSGGVSTIEAIACRLPVVTLPGQLMRGRHSYAILSQLGVTATIARDLREYVAIAVRLGLDRQWREDVVQKMTRGSAALYSDERCVSALEEFYRSAVSKRYVLDKGRRSATTRIARVPAP